MFFLSGKRYVVTIRPDCPLGRNSTPTPPNLPLSGEGQTEHSSLQGGVGGGFEANGLFGIKAMPAAKAASSLSLLVSAKRTGLSSQTTLACLRNLLFFKSIYFSLTSGANPLSCKEKSCFTA